MLSWSCPQNPCCGEKRAVTRQPEVGLAGKEEVHARQAALVHRRLVTDEAQPFPAETGGVGGVRERARDAEL
jgi:hypothetical protein